VKLSHEDSVNVWEEIAEWWDTAIGDGDIFHSHLVFPEVIKALDLFPNAKVLDLACGNGALSRKLKQLGADVIGVDVAKTFVEKASKRAKDQGLDIEYIQCDLTNENELKQIMEPYNGYFDRIVCSMSLHDISNIVPMIRQCEAMLSSTGSITVSIPHPCFNSGFFKFCNDESQKDVMGIFRSKYTNSEKLLVSAKSNQPQPHINYHRSLSALLSLFFEHGYKLTYLAEPSMEGKAKDNKDFFWSKLPEIPPVMVLRFSK
jgi:2-polyprenyl-3-methyl-5-hydroxy-6-metoxy-1,4-benzoquinol methylase